MDKRQAPSMVSVAAAIRVAVVAPPHFAVCTFKGRGGGCMRPVDVARL